VTQTDYFTTVQSEVKVSSNSARTEENIPSFWKAVA